MKKLLLAAVAVATMAPSAFATKTVTMTPVTDVTVVGPGGSVFSSTYVPGAVSGNDKFVASFGGAIPNVYDATGAPQGSLAPTGVPVGGLGFFALTAGLDGVIYGYEQGPETDRHNDLWKWNSVTDPSPILAWDTAAFARMGSVGGTGASTNLALTGSANNGPVEFFTGSAPFVTKTVEQLISKSGLAINPAATIAYTVGDTNLPIRKFVKTAGVWGEEVTNWVSPPRTGAGALTYDSVNDVLFSAPMGAGVNATVYAYDGTTGAELGTLDFTTAVFNTTPSYCGAVVIPDGLAGTVGAAARGATASNLALRKFTYVVVPESAVDAWTLY